MREPWAKLVRDGAGRVTAALPLIEHCLDVGAVAEIILRAWIRPLQAAAGRVLTEIDIARLVVLIALHDLGKANRGFNARTDRDAPPVGHTRQVAALLEHSKLQVHPAADLLYEMFENWGAYEHFVAVMAHHGKPLAEFRETNHKLNWVPDNARFWTPGDDGDPAAHVVTLIGAIRARWPLAWAQGAPLPDAPRFVALFAGLTTLADWLGSDADRFPVGGPYGAEREALRGVQAQAAAERRELLHRDTPSIDFETALGYPPHGFQTQAAADDLGPVALIEAETGSGKTEAALWRWIELRRRGQVDGLFFALPTRSAAVQLHARVNATLERLWGKGRVEAVLAVPGYLRAGDAQGQALPDYRVRWDRGDIDGAPDGRWAAERANRFLAARVAVGTIDQALLAALPVRHALFRAGVLSRSLLVVDEVHASDAYMSALLRRLLDHHVAVGGHALLLSATLGAAARATLLGGPRPSQAEAEAVPYPALSGQGVPPRAVPGADRPDKRVRIETAGIIADAGEIADRAIAAARAGAAVLVVRNTVAGAVAVAQAVAARADDVAFKVEGVATLHHGRFARADRQRLDAAVEEAFGKGRAAGGRVLVGTQTLEQSLDIDADYLITDLAPIDVLLQRIGRLHRHDDGKDRGAFADARVLVLRPEDRDLTPLLGHVAPRHGLGSNPGQDGVYPNLVQLEATLRSFEATPDIAIPRDNRRLVEGALHPHALQAIAAGLGGAWGDHLTSRTSRDVISDQTGGQIALDLSSRFTRIAFNRDGETVATRLGGHDLIVDLESPIVGPFGKAVGRIAIPAFLARGIGETDQPVPDGANGFTLGPRTYRYDQWGLHLVA